MIINAVRSSIVCTVRVRRYALPVLGPMPLVRSLAYVQRTYLYTTNIKMRRKIQRAGSESESIILGERERAALLQEQ
jgi:hypothetical protein